MRIWVMLAGLGLTAACGETHAPDANVEEAPANAAVEPVAAPPQAARPVLNITPGGVALVDPATGSSRELAFGTARDVVTRAAIAALGEPKERGINNECGEGPMRYVTLADGLSLWFQQDKLAGWFLRGAGSKTSTASGVGIGSTRKALIDAYAVKEMEGSTLGREFSTEGGGLSGLLGSEGDDAAVTALWSGQVCLFR